MNGIIVFAGLILFLWLGRSILIPLLIAAFLWYLTNAISDYYRKVLPFKNPTTKSEKVYWHIFNWTSFIASIVTIVLVIYVFITQIRPMFS